MSETQFSLSALTKVARRTQQKSVAGVSKAAEIIKGINKNEELGLTIFEFLGQSEIHGRRLSGVVIAKSFGKKSVYSVIAINSACDLSPRQVPIDNQGNKAAMATYVSDLIDAKTQAHVDKMVAEHTSTSGANISGIVPVRVPETSEEFGTAVSIAFDLAVDNIEDVAVLCKLSQMVEPPLEQLTKHFRPKVEVHAGDQHINLIDGTPRRADLQVNMLLTEQAEGSEEVTKEYVSTSGYMNLQYKKPEAQTVNGQTIPGTQQYIKEFKVTDVSAELGEMTLGRFLLGCFNMVHVISRNAWKVPYVNPTFNGGQFQHHNLGALNMDIPSTGDNAYKKLTTGDASWATTSPENPVAGIDAFTDMYFLPGFLLSVELARSGRGSRIQQMLTMASYSGNNQSLLAKADQAQLMLRNELDRMTGNRFTKLYPAGDIVARGTARRTTLATYCTPEGVERDAADLDMVAAFNRVSEKDVGLALEYIETTRVDSTKPEALRLADNKALAERILGTKLTPYDVAVTVTFKPEATVAAMSAILNSEGGFNVEGSQWNTGTNTRVDASLVNQYVDTTNHTMFSMQPQTPAAQFNQGVYGGVGGTGDLF